jgi:hypothetical protein
MKAYVNGNAPIYCTPPPSRAVSIDRRRRRNHKLAAMRAAMALSASPE